MNSMEWKLAELKRRLIHEARPIKAAELHRMITALEAALARRNG